MTNETVPDPWDCIDGFIYAATPVPPGGQHVGHTKYQMTPSTAKALRLTIQGVRAEVERRHAEEIAELTAQREEANAVISRYGFGNAAIEIARLKAEHAETERAMVESNAENHARAEAAEAERNLNALRADNAERRAEHLRAQLAAAQKKRDETREWEHW